MPKLAGRLTLYPARALFIWYLVLVILGTLLLTQSFCANSARPPITWLEGCFTATSAACVTGLSVRSTAHDFNFFGQFIILVLIQLGGIGIMTVATFITLHWTGRESFRQRAALVETLGTNTSDDLSKVLRSVVGFTLVFEGAGFVILFLRFLYDKPALFALWHALFHSISAFCNAGFALADNSLTQYRSDPFVNLTIMMLVLVGGIGYPVLLDLRRNGKKPVRTGWRALTLHSKLVLIGTVSLFFIGTFTILVLEHGHLLKGMTLNDRVLVAAFHSVSVRTAGFNTVDLSQMTNATIFILIILMAIGAGACSTGGGFKVSTLMVLVLHAWTRVKGRRKVTAFRRGVAPEVVERAIATVLLFILIGIIALTMLLVVEDNRLPHLMAKWGFLDAVFEVVSALGTVGLSLGFTSELNTPGSLLIIVLMFIGRIGPISIIIVLARPVKESHLEFPSDEILIG